MMRLREVPKFVVLQLLRGYKWAISPLLPPACRYIPTCSEYAMEAVERYGVVRGGLKAAWRLLRCHPFAHGGYDPVVRKNADLVSSNWDSMSQMRERASETKASVVMRPVSQR